MVYPPEGGPGRFGSGPAGVALAYVAVAWVVIQVVDSLDSLLGLPAALVRGALVLLLVGFPVVVATSWVQRSFDGSSGSGDRPGLLGLFTWRNALWGGVGVAAFWGAVAAVWLVGVGGPGAAEMPSPEEAGPRSLAVLPLDNLLPEGEEMAWLVSGIHEQIIHELTRVPGLRVRSRTSVLPYAASAVDVPEIGRRLGVDAILEGSVRSDSGTLRATLQLIDARTDEHEWSEEYDVRLENLLEVQTTVARRVAGTFRRTADTLRGAEVRDAGVDPEALRLYLQGRHLWKNIAAAPSEQAFDLFREAVEIDPDFALAWASLAEAWLSSAHVGVPPHTAFPRADSAALQALAADPGLAEAHVALADTRFHYDWNYEAAERDFRRAIDLNPSHATASLFYAGLLATLGRADEAARQVERARQMDPVSPVVHAFGARVLHWGGRRLQAEALIEEAVRLAPSNPYALGVLGFIHLEAGRVDEAVEAFRRSTAVVPKFLPGFALALARAGRTDEARDVVERIEAMAADRYVAPYERAMAYVGTGDRERALSLLEEATGTRDAELIWVAVEPVFEPLREEPRFRAVLRTVGLEHVTPPVGGSRTP